MDEKQIKKLSVIYNVSENFVRKVSKLYKDKKQICEILYETGNLFIKNPDIHKNIIEHNQLLRLKQLNIIDFQNLIVN